MSDKRNRLAGYSDAELLEMAQGCTEFTCIYHGSYNMERRRRQQRDFSRKDDR